MKFYREKFKEIRIRKKFQIKELAEKMELNRSTLWLWEKGKIQPSEKKIKALAKILDISLDIISDMQPEIPVSETETGKYKKVISSWISLTDTDLRNRAKNQEKYLNILINQLKESNQAISVFRALINFSDAMLYVKDVNQKYIAASKTFLKLLSLPEERSLIGKTDSDIFPKHEAKENLEEDERIMSTGKAVRNKESLIPGSRKKKWGIISKIPTFDSEGKITGIIGSFMDITGRKNAELLIEQFKKGLEIMDEAIWIAKNARERTEGGVAFDHFLYAVDDKLRKALLIENSNLSLEELWNYGNFLVVGNDERKKMKLDELIQNKETEVRFKLEIPSSQKIIYVKNKIYYDPSSELFVGVITEDTESKRVEKIVKILRKRRIDEEIINEVVQNRG